MRKVSLQRGFVLVTALFVILPTSKSSVFTNVHEMVLPYNAIPTCRVPSGVISHSNPKDTPLALQDAIRQKLGYTVLPNSAFDSTDVVITGHNRRFIFIWERGSNWVVATEHGGRGYNNPVLAYQVDVTGMQIRLIAERIAFPSTLCSIAESLLKVGSSVAPVH